MKIEQGQGSEKEFALPIEASTIGKSMDTWQVSYDFYENNLTGCRSDNHHIVVTFVHLHFIQCIFKPSVTNTVPILNKATYLV